LKNKNKKYKNKMSFFAIKKTQPTVAENGTPTFFNLIPNQVNTAIQYFSSKMIQNDQLRGATPGIYTWILKPSGFYAIKTISKQELGTLHANLDVFSGKTKDNPVQAAGEMKVTMDGGQVKVLFNLLSGTYMKRIFSGISAANDPGLRNSLIQMVQSHLAHFGILAEFLECIEPCSQEEIQGGQALLEPTNIRTSSENMRILKSMFANRSAAKGGVRRHTRKSKQRQTRRRRSY